MHPSEINSSKQFWLTRLFNSEVGRKLAADYAKEQLTARQKIVAEIARIEAEAQRELPALEAAAEKAHTAVEAAYAKYKALQGPSLIASTKVLDAKNRRNTQVDSLRAELRKTASPFIQEAWDKLWDLEQRAMKRHTNEYAEDLKKFNPITAAKKYKFYSETLSKKAYLAAIREAKRLIMNEWPYQALAEEEMRHMFESILAKLPKIEMQLIGEIERVEGGIFA